jgi:hypothetical protein
MITGIWREIIFAMVPVTMVNEFWLQSLDAEGYVVWHQTPVDMRTALFFVITHLQGQALEDETDSCSETSVILTA